MQVQPQRIPDTPLIKPAMELWMQTAGRWLNQIPGSTSIQEIKLTEEDDELESEGNDI